jgi:hypothetical protein
MPKAGGLKNPIVQIPRLVAARQYRVGLHAVRHMIEEGFDEKQLVEALSGRIHVLEEYPDEGRFLVLGRFHFTPATTSALHTLCDLSDERVLDIVTAYIPQRPWWSTPTQRGRRK